MTPIVALVCAVAIADWGPIRVDAEGVPLPPGVIARIGSTRMRHDGWLSEVHFTSDGRRLLGYHNGALSTWDARTGRRLRVDTLPGMNHNCSAWRADGRLVYVAAVHDGEQYSAHLRTLDVETGTIETVKRFADGSPCVSPDGTRVALRNNGYVRVYDTRTGKAVGETRLSISDYDPAVVVISPDNRLLAAVYSGWVEVREIATGNVAYTGVPAASSQYRDAVFSPDSRELCFVWEKQKFAVEVIDLKTEKRTELTACDTFYSPTYSPDGRTIYGIRNSELVRIDRTTKAVVSVGKGFSRATSTRLALSPDGAALAVGGIRYRLTLHDTKTGRRLPPTEDRFEAATSAIAFTTDGTKLAFNSDGEDDGFLVHVASGKLSKAIEYNDNTCQFLANGNSYAIGTAKKLEVRSVASDVVEAKVDLKLPWPPSLQVSQDGRRLFAFGSPSLLIWDLGKQQKVTGRQDKGYTVHPTPDGRLAVLCPAAAQKDTPYVRLIDLVTGKNHPRWPTIHDPIIDRIWSVLFDPAGRMAVLCQGRQVTLVDLATFDLRQLPIPAWSDQACIPAFSRDARTLAVLRGEVPALCLWELSSGKIRHTIPLTDSVISLAFGPDTRLIAVHSTTAPVHLYDLRGALLDLPKRLDRDSLAALWKSLNGNDAPEAFAVLRRLSAAPDSTLPFLRERVKPATAVAMETISTLLESLDSPAFAEREKAAAELTRIADKIEVELRASEKATASPEVRQRLEKILLSLRPDSPESVRRSRIVEVVEWCGTPDAKTLMKDWAAGARGAALTREAKEALARLER